MNVRRRLGAFLLMFLLCVGMLSVSAFAASTSQDGLKVTLSADKEKYSQNEKIVTTLTVENANDTAVSDVTLENLVPNGYKLADKSEATKQVQTLKAGETVSLTVTYAPEKEQTNQGNQNSNQSTPTNTNSNNGAGKSGKGTTQNNTSKNGNNPGTGDNSNLTLWAVLLVLAGVGIVVTVVLRKKSGKKILSLLLSMFIINSFIIGLHFKAYAKENNAHSVNIQTTVFVAGNNLTLNSTVTYELNASSDGSTLSNFMSDETSFLAGYEADITFTVNATSITESISLCDGSNNTIGIMHDDGLNGDSSANDGIFTYTMTALVDKASSIDYYAKSGGTSSERVTINFFPPPTKNSQITILDAQEKMKEIESKYANEKGYISNKNVSTVITEVAQYVDRLCREGIVIYSEINDRNIVLQFSSGFMMVYSPNVEGLDSIGSDVEMSITTCQPCLSTYNTSSGMALIDSAATMLDNTFSNYSFTQNYDNDQVTLDKIKAFSPNQIILWHGHGGYSSREHSYVLTGEDFNWNAWWWNPVYCLDNLQGRIIEASNGRVCITSKYISKYCGNLNNALIYIAACQSGRDNVLANAFLNKGATAVIANSETIYTQYNLKIQHSIMQFMAKINSQTENYYTLDEALSAAKNDYGANDIIWAQHEGFTDIKHEVATPTIFGGTNANNYRLSDAKVGTLSGKICTAVDRTTPVNGANITIYKNSTLYTTLASNNTGNYSVALPIGEYQIKITSDGYIAFTAYATVTENSNTYMETFLLVEGDENETGVASGNIYNALTGNGLDDVTLTIRKGWNNSNIGDIIETTKTGTNGSYSVTLPIGNYTMYATKDGFISTPVNIIVQKGTTDSQNGTMTPTLSGNNYRIVLTWGANPRDLDSHVVGTLSNGNSFHTYYSHKSQYDGNTEVCNLDVDDTSSYGPETITLNATTDNPYYYYIYRYGGSGTLSSSNAQVRVYQGGNLLGTFNVPTDQGNGDYWNVFAIVNGKFVVKDTITSDADINYASVSTNALPANFAAEDNAPKKKVSIDKKPAQSDSDKSSNTSNTTAAKSKANAASTDVQSSAEDFDNDQEEITEDTSTS